MNGVTAELFQLVCTHPLGRQRPGGQLRRVGALRLRPAFTGRPALGLAAPILCPPYRQDRDGHDAHRDGHPLEVLGSPYCFAVARTASVTALMSPFCVSSRAAFAWASAVARMVSIAIRAAS